MKTWYIHYNVTVMLLVVPICITMNHILISFIYSFIITCVGVGGGGLGVCGHFECYKVKMTYKLARGGGGVSVVGNLSSRTSMPLQALTPNTGYLFCFG